MLGSTVMLDGANLISREGWRRGELSPIGHFHIDAVVTRLLGHDLTPLPEGGRSRLDRSPDSERMVTMAWA